MFDTMGQVRYGDRGPRQLSLLGTGEAEVPATLTSTTRVDLGRGAWIDHQNHWLDGAEGWLEELQATVAWKALRRPMYDRVVEVPRLIANWDRSDMPPKIAALADLFEQRYGVRFPSVGVNWYRDGNDSVAWHVDSTKVPGDSIVAIIGVGERRPFDIRPIPGATTGGRSATSDHGALGAGRRDQRRRWMTGDGDLIVLGGTFQAYWQHAIPKVPHAGDRISIQVRTR